jgi:hypothetical protein
MGESSSSRSRPSSMEVLVPEHIPSLSGTRMLPLQTASLSYPASAMYRRDACNHGYAGYRRPGISAFSVMSLRPSSIAGGFIGQDSHFDAQ